ncbi:MAG: 2-amino-4-hydroxy-6-hydroxymethyldihydropteridine diphosphokinase [Acidobacteriota bacterium]
MNNADVYLSLGSNLGDRKKNIQSALKRLVSSGVKAVSVSSFYESEPVGDREQPAYINIVCVVETTLSPFELLDLCQEIEKISGRTSKGDSAPRCIDIDILLHGSAEISSLRLTVPHLRMYRRNFVLIPLKEIQPDFMRPDTGRGIDQLIKECGDQSWVKILD